MAGSHKVLHKNRKTEPFFQAHVLETKEHGRNEREVGGCLAFSLGYQESRRAIFAGPKVSAGHQTTLLK